MIDLNRRRFLGFLAAPAIVRAMSLMRISPAIDDATLFYSAISDNQRWLVAEMETSIRKALSWQAPVYWDDAGTRLLSDAISVTFNLRPLSVPGGGLLLAPQNNNYF